MTALLTTEEPFAPDPDNDPRVVPLAPQPAPQEQPGVQVDAVTKVFSTPGGPVRALESWSSGAFEDW